MWPPEEKPGFHQAQESAGEGHILQAGATLLSTQHCSYSSHVKVEWPTRSFPTHSSALCSLRMFQRSIFFNIVHSSLLTRPQLDRFNLKHF